MPLIQNALDWLVDDLYDAGVGGNDWLLTGSIVLWLHGLRQDVGDIDMFVTPKAWDRLNAHLDYNGRWWKIVVPNPEHPPLLRKKITWGMTVDAWKEWAHPQDMTVEHAFATREVFKGFSVMGLTTLRDWKMKLSDPKHPRDVKIINDYLDAR